MNTLKILTDLDFGTIIAESAAQTQTGAEFLDKYKSYLMMKESSCGLVNSFVQEAKNIRYDNGVHKTLSIVADYINMNKTSWALATACENINKNEQSYNYLNRNAASQVEKLLEMNEEDVVKYIKAGALKNVMFCESFRNIAKQVFKDTPIVEANAEYTTIHPVSMIENMGDGFCFEVCGNLYKMNEDKSICEADWKEVSNTFKTVSSLLESNICSVSENDITINYDKYTYVITEGGKCKKCKKGECEEEKCMKCADEVRENNRLMVMAANPRRKNELAGVLEAIALTCENYDNIVNLDNVAVYSTNRDKFIVIEGEDTMYSTLVASNRSSKWTINEDVITTLSFIKSKTNVSLDENYNEKISKHVEKVSEEEKQEIQMEMENQEINSYKDRIAALTEKFKDNPAKLAILANLANELSTLE